MTATNFFSNQDPNLPNLKSLKLPKIKKGLPKIQMTKDSDLLFEIDGKNIYANVQSVDLKPVEEKKWEVHRKYIDIQYVITQKEKMGYGILEDFKTIIEKYDDNRDVEFLDGEKFNFVDVNCGYFVIFYPNDVHAPMLRVDKAEKIKKVIVKILL